jgi:hypothetical protein
MEKEFFELLGLGVPFYLAAATYGVFYWLDPNASDEATKVISSWLRGRSHNKPDLGNLIIDAFDRIYTSPLLTFRAFRRSAAITAIIWLVIYFAPFLAGLFKRLNDPLSAPLNFYLILLVRQMTFLVIFILSDYVSLPFVRRFLNLAQTSPIRASVFSSLVGLVVVIVCLFIFAIASAITAHWVLPYYYALALIDTGNISPTWLLIITRIRPAFIIHVWLPLFALSSLLVKLIYLIFRAVEWAQWFLKQGDAHPLKAIGIVATIIVFGSAMLVKEAWTVL